MSCHKTLLVLALSASLPMSQALACGPDFPYRLLSDRQATLDQLPDGLFAYEMTLLGKAPAGLGHATEATLEPQWGDSTQRQLQSRLEVEQRQLPAEQFRLVNELRTFDDARQAFARGEALPAELRLYTAGAVAFAHDQMALAAEYFKRLLALPAAERPLRSTWAAYSLGRALAEQSRAVAPASATALRQQADAAFDQVQQLRRDDFDDPLELGIASLGEQARLALDEGNWERAIRLYASQHVLGSPTGYGSLRQLARQLNALDAASLTPLLELPAVQHLLVAQAFSAIDAPDAQQRLMHLDVQLAPNLADRMAALAYKSADYALARQWLEQASDSGLSYWLRAKLALQAGDQQAATAAYAHAAKAFPATQDWGLQRHEYGDIESLKPRCRVAGEMAILSLQRGDYLEAFEQLYRSGEIYWQDAAEVAERVLSVRQLREYVDANVPAPKLSTEQLLDTWQWPVAARLRELLARRLMREGEYASAREYFIDPERQQLARDYAYAQKQGSDAWTAIGRAEGLYQAARMARQNGLELLGYELSPDEAWTGGAFGAESFKPVKAERWRSADEARRQNASAAEPNRRFHYRWVAADLASRAADLLPPRSQAYAAVLCNASGWINYRDLPGAQALYQRYVSDGPYVPWAANFGFNCQAPDFVRAEELLWRERAQTLRQTLRPYRYGLYLAAAGLVAAGVYWLRRRRAS